jgi:superfamily II DNA/RNA helicase
MQSLLLTSFTITLSPIPAHPNAQVMDEYLHMAGRTGRLAGVGLTAKAGTVVTVVTYDELKRLKSWETPLGIQFDVVYQRA